ncbi:MAG: hypothetical protein IT384_08870 [Deltaproteobacteria bacterium]|nr:hypothetical protein [Deltaproteobacteria bacterium]
MRLTTLTPASLCAALLLSACAGGSNDATQGTSAINLSTGERRTFAGGETLPDGWVECEDDACPTPLACEGLGEAACLAREDCFASYAELWPQECESENPPAYCADLPYVGCATRQDGGDEGTVGCGVVAPDGQTVPDDGTCPDDSGTVEPTDPPTDPVTPDCGQLPLCELQCPEGHVHPVDENGCEHTCECVNG